MAAQSERVHPDASPSNTRPIELITENGHSIVRSWEISETGSPVRGPYEFLVQTSDRERTVVVEIDGDLLIRIQIHTCDRILASNSFWICCAERHLAAYLSEHDECPRDGKLRVEDLTPGDLNLSIRWERT